MITYCTATQQASDRKRPLHDFPTRSLCKRWHTILLGILIAAAAGAAVAKSSHDGHSHTTEYEYDASGRLATEIIGAYWRGDQLETRYTYDIHGNRIKTTVSSPTRGTAAMAPRTDRLTYDARGQFPATHRNAEQHIAQIRVDTRFGNVAGLTDPNGLHTQWQYDEFGRVVREIGADGTQTRWDYHYCQGVHDGNASCPRLARYLIEITPLAADGSSANGPWHKTYYDSVQREIRNETVGFDGHSIIAQDTEYDQLGRVARRSLPYFDGQTPQWQRFNYDRLHRLVNSTGADGSHTTMRYSGLSTSVTNALQQTQTSTKNSRGQLLEVADADNNRLRYHYDAGGNLISTIDPHGNDIRMHYDGRGRKTRMTDPDMGMWIYAYNPMNELVQQTNAEKQTSRMQYDRLGRLISREEADLKSHFVYDQCALGIGKLCTASTDNGYQQTHHYDQLGRNHRTDTEIDTTYTDNVSFDEHGRVATQTWPTGLSLKYVYSNLGALQEIRDQQSDALYWRVDTHNALGQTLQQTYGNQVVTQHVFNAATGRLQHSYAGAGNQVQQLDYHYDALGNLISRNDGNQQLSETFLYDNLNRLTHAMLNAPAADLSPLAIRYDELGNILRRSDVGHYEFLRRLYPHTLQRIRYHASDPHEFRHDRTGAMTAEMVRPAAQPRAIRYTSFNMPQRIIAGNVTPRHVTTFTYGPEHQRLKKITPAGTTVYLHPDNSGSLFYEKEIKADGSTEHRHFITADGQVIAIIKQHVTQQGATQQQTYYLHRDHLGSITAITDEQGEVVERLAYDAYGQRRFPAGNRDDANQLRSKITNRGYTGHEHLDDHGLIHMNGRIYDPRIGRFLSADPHVTSPDSLQSFNRYAYVLNNPLALTDPSGYDWDDCGIDTCANLRRSAGLPPIFATDRSAHWDLALPLQWNRFAPMPLPGYYPAQHENGEIVQLPYLRPVATQNNSLPPVTVISSSDNSGVMDNYLTREQQLWAEPGAASFSVLEYLIPLSRLFNSLRVIGAAMKGVNGKTSLFRAVGPAELADIKTRGILRNLGSAEGKYFTTSAEAAASYAKQAVKGFGDAPYTLIETRVPNKIFRGLSAVTVDRGVPAWVIPTGRLPGLTPKALDAMPIPH